MMLLAIWALVHPQCREGRSWELELSGGSADGRPGTNCPDAFAAGGWEEFAGGAGTTAPLALVRLSALIPVSAAPASLPFCGSSRVGQAGCMADATLLPPSTCCFSSEEVHCRPLLLKQQSPCGGCASELFLKGRVFSAREGRKLVRNQTWWFIQTSTFV